MRNCYFSRFCRLAIIVITQFSYLVLIFGFVTSVSAEDASDNANAMLENLKRRSAEERWQRIKRLYPSDASAVRFNSPTGLPDDQLKGASEDRIPPSPEQTLLIPRIAALPNDSDNDWILPAPSSPMDDSSFVPSPEAPLMIDSTLTEMKQLRSPMRVALQDAEIGTEAEQKPIPASSRNVLSRKMSDINPYYERDRDTDIREFANEKIKEYEGQFHPRTFENRAFPEIALNWEASNLFCYPLYFSDPALERTGHTYHPVVQPFASIARFGVQFAMLPYQMTLTPPCTQVSPLGWYRPGECAPKLHYQPPLNIQAAVVEAAAVTGIYFVIP